MKKLIAFFVEQDIFVDIITIFVLVGGIYSVANINREVFPNVSFDQVIVSTIYPGASADSVERLITTPLEQDIREIDGIKELTSTSIEGRSSIRIKLDPDQTTADEGEREIQDIVDAFTELPDGAEDPIVATIETKKQPVIEVSIAGNVSEELLREKAKFLEKQIEAIPQVAKINFNGLRDFEIHVIADPVKLGRYQVSLEELINALKNQNVSIPGGVLEPAGNRTQEILVRTIGEFESAADVGEVVIRANALGKAIKVSDVALIKRTLEKTSIISKTNGIPSISMTVLKKENADVIRLTDELKEKLKTLDQKLGPDIKLTYVNDTSFLVTRRISVLANNLFVGLALVLIILSIILPVRVALVTAFGIPFAFLATLAIFQLSGISLNLISMIGLIIVFGMLVDDAVVVTENIQAKTEQGLSRFEGAVLGTQQIYAPITASVMTTVIAFLPILLMEGIFGQFVKNISFGVIIALLISLAECFFILPNHMRKWTGGRNLTTSNTGAFDQLWQNLVARPYDGLVKRIIRYRYPVLIISTMYIGGTVFYAFKTKNFVLFPKEGIDTFYINIETPVGSTFDETASRVSPVEGVLKTLPDTEMSNFTTKVGQTVSADDLRGNTGSQFAQIFVYLTPEIDRERTTLEILEAVRSQVGQPEGISKITFQAVSGGPPTGKAIDIGVQGKSYEKIMEGVANIETKLKSLKGAVDVENTYVEGKKEFHVQVIKDSAAAAGLTAVDIGNNVRAAFDGIIATSIRTVDEEEEIRVIFPEKSRSDQETIEKIMILNRRGQRIQLSRVAEVIPATGISSYEHENNERQVRVLGGVDPEVTTSVAINEIMAKHIKEIEGDYPDISFRFGGEIMDTNESLEDLFSTFMFAFMGIFFILVLLFKNIYQPIIVATTIPLAVCSIVWVFLAHGKPLSFLGIIGLIALSGIVVNNAIVFVDFFNRAKEDGKSVAEAIRFAANRRIRPIFLTTVTTVAGILPTAYGIGGLDPFVVPIALSLGWGVFFGSILTITVLPAVLGFSMDVIRLRNKFSQKK